MEIWHAEQQGAPETPDALTDHRVGAWAFQAAQQKYSRFAMAGTSPAPLA